MPGQYFFILNTSDKPWQGLYAQVGYSAPSGKAIRLDGKGDDANLQFEPQDADCLISCIEPERRHLFKKSQKEDTVPPEKIIPAPPPAASKDIPNADGKDYPDGMPQMDWSGPQIHAWLKINDPKIEARTRLTSPPEAMILAIWKVHAKDMYDRYQVAIGKA